MRFLVFAFQHYKIEMFKNVKPTINNGKNV
jgi:hypothetical protein